MRPNDICCMGGNLAGVLSSCVIAFKCPEVRITVVDNEKTISQWNSDNLPFEEPELHKIIKKCRHRNLFFSSNYASSIKEADMIFLPLNVSQKAKSETKKVLDFRELEETGKLIAAHSESDKIVVEKSKMAARAVEEITMILDSYSKPGVRHYVLSNPVTVSQGFALKELLNPNYVLIGCQKNPNNRAAAHSLCELYENWIPRKKIKIMDNWSVDVSLLAVNAFLAQKRASLNALATICEKTKTDINKIAAIIGSDIRIETKNISPMSGFGKFQRGLSNLISTCESLELHEAASYWQAVVEVNRYQISQLFSKIKTILDPMENKEITILGFARDKGTSETKNSLALKMCKWLLHKECRIKIYDPVVQPEQIMNDLHVELKKDEGNRIQIFTDIYSAFMGTSGIIICTDRDEFLDIDYQRMMGQMKKPIVIDGHKFLNGNFLKGMGIEYHTLALI